MACRNPGEEVWKTKAKQSSICASWHFLRTACKGTPLPQPGALSYEDPAGKRFLEGSIEGEQRLWTRLSTMRFGQPFAVCYGYATLLLLLHIEW